MRKPAARSPNSTKRKSPSTRNWSLDSPEAPPNSKTSTMLRMIPNAGVFIAGMVLFLVVLWDAFEAIILPRRVTRKFRFTRVYYRSTWRIWKTVAKLLPTKKRKETFFGFYGPISLLFLIAVWAVGLVISFGMMQFGAGSAINLSGTT